MDSNHFQISELFNIMKMNLQCTNDFIYNHYNNRTAANNRYNNDYINPVIRVDLDDNSTNQSNDIPFTNEVIFFSVQIKIPRISKGSLPTCSKIILYRVRYIDP